MDVMLTWTITFNIQYLEKRFRATPSKIPAAARGHLFRITVQGNFKTALRQKQCSDEYPLDQPTQYC